jgi:hypothetical protein
MNPAILNPPTPGERPARGDVLPPASSRATFTATVLISRHVVARCRGIGDGRQPWSNRSPSAPFAGLKRHLSAGLHRFAFLFRALIQPSKQSSGGSPVVVSSPFVVPVHKAQHSEGIGQGVVKV